MKACIRPGNKRQDKKFTISIAFSHQRVQKFIPTAYVIDKNQIDKNTGRIRNHPNADVLNERLNHLINHFEKELTLLGHSVNRYSPVDLRQYLINTTKKNTSTIQGLTFTQFGYGETQKIRKERSNKTADIDDEALKKIDKFAPGIYIEDITPDWLKKFAGFLRKTNNDNTISIRMRSIRKIYNLAIDQGLIEQDAYPFKSYEIPEGEEPEHKDIDIADLIKIWHCQGLTSTETIALNIAKLTYLLAGINFIDLIKLPPNKKDGRIDYLRTKSARTKKRKTKTSIKIEPETWELIQTMPGEKELIKLPFKYTNYEDSRRYVTRLLKKIAKKAEIENWEKICLYSFRDSWATHAYNIAGVRIEDIEFGLGHSLKEKKVTFSYIKRDLSRLDNGNRLLIDTIYK